MQNIQIKYLKQGRKHWDIIKKNCGSVWVWNSVWISLFLKIKFSSHHPSRPLCSSLSPSPSDRCVSACSLQLWLLHRRFPPPSIFTSLAPQASFSGQTGSYGAVSWGLLLQPRQLCFLSTNGNTSLFQTFTSTHTHPTSAAHPVLASPCYKFAYNFLSHPCCTSSPVVCACHSLAATGTMRWNVSSL